LARLIDISPVVRPGGPTWPGDAPTRLLWTERIADGARANVGALSCSTHAGAHVDAPKHVIEGAGDIGALPLDAFWGPARVVDPADLSALPAGVERVLIRTGGAGHLALDIARSLIERRVRLVGIDSLSVDVEGDPAMPVHVALSRAGIAILECLRLEDAPMGDYELVALPLKIEGADASPVRAVLRSR
jgi:arylformamidase